MSAAQAVDDGHTYYDRAAPSAKVMFCLDPGLRESGAALFLGDIMVIAMVVKNPEKTARGAPAWAAMARAVYAELDCYGPPDVCAVEVMRRRKWGKDPIPAAVLLELNGISAAFLGRCGASDSRSFLPEQWKGLVKADVMTGRILERLTFDERARIRDAGAKTHNAIDAVGIGLHVLGRLKPPVKRFARCGASSV